MPTITTTIDAMPAISAAAVVLAAVAALSITKASNVLAICRPAKQASRFCRG
jgi:hypothetical protein